jgi:hypothetical protein
MSILRKSDFQPLAKYVVVGHWGKHSTIGLDGGIYVGITSVHFHPKVVHPVCARTLGTMQASDVNVCASACSIAVRANAKIESQEKEKCRAVYGAAKWDN